MGFFNMGNNGKDKDTVSEQEEFALREAYQDMVKLAAWKDFRNKMTDVKNSPIQILDQSSLTDITLSHAGFIKGVRAGISALEKKIDYILMGGTPNG